MKNIHILPTNKPSRLFIDIDNDKLTITNNLIGGEHFMNQNIYITNDEEIKVSDWYLDTFNTQRIKANEFSDHKHYGNACKKIILTTDQDLINDGIEQISEDTLLKIVEHINSGKNIESFNEL